MLLANVFFSSLNICIILRSCKCIQWIVIILVHVTAVSFSFFFFFFLLAISFSLYLLAADSAATFISSSFFLSVFSICHCFISFLFLFFFIFIFQLAAEFLFDWAMSHSIAPMVMSHNLLHIETSILNGKNNKNNTQTNRSAPYNTFVVSSDGCGKLVQ